VVVTGISEERNESICRVEEMRIYQNQQLRHCENVTFLSPTLNTTRYSAALLTWSTIERGKNLLEDILN